MKNYQKGHSIVALCSQTITPCWEKQYLIPQSVWLSVCKTDSSEITHKNLAKKLHQHQKNTFSHRRTANTNNYGKIGAQRQLSLKTFGLTSRVDEKLNFRTSLWLSNDKNRRVFEWLDILYKFDCFQLKICLKLDYFFLIWLFFISNSDVSN